MCHERDISAIKHIIRYCDEINDAITRHELTLEKITSDSIYKNALSMCILQIGELTNVLSEEFRSLHQEIPWREIKRMRDKAAHHYGAFDVNALWETVTEDIEPLKRFCLLIIAETL
jgi:uncharacterized protein with HEPN domain